MKRIIIYTLLGMLSFESIHAQSVVDELYGFKLGQYRETTKELGKPFLQGNYNDGFEYEAFSLAPDSSLFIVFEYAASATDVIWSIQVSETNDTHTEIGFKKGKLGMDSVNVLKTFGSPTTKESAGVYGMRWEYEKLNYSFEINPDGKLSSIKIKESNLNNQPDASKIPSFNELAKKLTTITKNSDLVNWVAPDIEISYNGSTLFFSKSIATEIKTDDSGVFKTLKLISKDLDKINTKDPSVYEENMRVSEKQSPTHVIKIKKGHVIKEIVLKYRNGQYVIWEIKT